MKRADALAHIRLAGYHSDDRAFMRLYTENRISYETAKQARDAGAAAKRAGVQCNCHSCKAEPEPKFGPECSICTADMLHAGPCVTA